MSDKPHLVLRTGRAKAVTKKRNLKVECLNVRPVKFRSNFNGLCGIVGLDDVSVFLLVAVCPKSSRDKTVLGQILS
jgi:hypothetical protein